MPRHMAINLFDRLIDHNVSATERLIGGTMWAITGFLFGAVIVALAQGDISNFPSPDMQHAREVGMEVGTVVGGLAGLARGMMIAV